MAAFAQTVAEGSFSAAARTLGVSPQRVAKQVGALEAELGTALLHRTTRHQALTAAGAAYHERVRAILAAVDDAQACASREDGTARGLLRITAPNTFGSFLAPLLRSFLEAHPRVEIDCVLTDRFVDLAGEGIEAGFRIGAESVPGLDAMPLAPFRLALAAAPDYLARHGTPRTPDDLRGHDCLEYAFPDKRSWREWRLTSETGSKRVPVAGRLRINDARAMVAAAEAGLGIVLAGADLLAAPIAAGRLVGILSDYRLIERPMHLVFPKSRFRSPRLERFIEIAIAAFPPE